MAIRTARRATRISLPLVGAFVALLLPSTNQRLFRGFGIAVALATFLQSLLVLFAFKSGQGGFQLGRFQVGSVDQALAVERLAAAQAAQAAKTPGVQNQIRTQSQALLEAALY